MYVFAFIYVIWIRMILLSSLRLSNDMYVHMCAIVDACVCICICNMDLDDFVVQSETQ